MNIKLSKISSLQLFQFIRYFSLLLVSILIAKSNLGVENIGIFETKILIGSSISFFWLNAIVKTLLTTYNETKYKNKFFSILIITAFLGVLSYLLLNVIFVFGNFKIENSPSLNIFFIYIVTIAPASISEYFLLLKNKTRNLLFYGIFIFTVQILLTIFALYNYNDIKSLFEVLIFVNILKIIYALYLINKYEQFKISRDYIIYSIKLARPLMFSFLLSGSAQYIDSFLVSWRFDASVFAIFKYGTKEFPLLIILTDSFSNAVLSDFKNSGLKETLNLIKNKSEKYMHIFFPVFFVLLLSSQYLYKIFFSEKFIESSVVFDAYLLIIVSRLTFPQTIVLGLKKNNVIFRASLYELIVNVILSVVFIFYFGIFGVAIATVIAYYFEKIYLMRYLYIKQNISANNYLNIKILTLYSLILYALFFAKLIQLIPF